jgi:hypothetical protein
VKKKTQSNPKANRKLPTLFAEKNNIIPLDEILGLKKFAVTMIQFEPFLQFKCIPCLVKGHINCEKNPALFEAALWKLQLLSDQKKYLENWNPNDDNDKEIKKRVVRT